MQAISNSLASCISWAARSCPSSGIGPAVILALQLAGIAIGQRQRSGPVLADIEETTQHAIVAAHGNDWPAGDFGDHVIACISQLAGARQQLPAHPKNMLPFEGMEGRIRIGISRQGYGFGKRLRRHVLWTEAGGYVHVDL